MREAASPFAEASAFVEATVDETEDGLILETAVAILANLLVKSFPRRE